jgi:hypothetical protein
VEAGVGCVTLSLGGYWDHHYEIFKKLPTALRTLDRGVAALAADLSERGLDKEISVVVWGEFGRTPHINHGPSNAGRDLTHQGDAIDMLLRRAMGKIQAHYVDPSGKQLLEHGRLRSGRPQSGNYFRGTRQSHECVLQIWAGRRQREDDGNSDLAGSLALSR